MKKIYVFLFLCFFALLNGKAQEKVLSAMPAPDQPAFQQSMETLGTWEEPQLEMMAASLKPGQQDNTALQYALNGFAGYVMQPGKESWRSKTVQAYGKALNKLQDPVNDQFLIRQLQLIGKDDAVPFLQKYLSDQQLVHPAAQALATINTALARQTLLTALQQSTSDETTAALIQALGDCRNAAAAPVIKGLLKRAKNAAVRKTALYALANIGNPASSGTILDAAKRSHYRFSDDNAASNTLLYIQRLMEGGQGRTAEKVIKTLKKKTGGQGQATFHQAVLQLQNQMHAPMDSEIHNQLTPQEKKEGFTLLFNGKDLNLWTGNKDGYKAVDGSIVVNPAHGSGGNLYTKEEYGNFIFRFQFQLTPGANNGIGIRAPLEGDAAYVGMEIQVLDNTADMYKDLHPYQYHGSVYGVIPAKRGYLKPVGEWNTEEIRAEGPKITVTLNGHVIVDGDIDKASENGTADGNAHPGLKNKTGHIGFLGHGSVVKFRDLRVKKL